MLRVATCQMTSGSDIEANLQIAESLIKHAAKQGAELVVLPEMFATMGVDQSNLLKAAEKAEDGPIQSHISNLAASLGLWICAGSVALKSDVKDHVTNSCLVYDPYGQLAARYDKIHLFSYQSKTESYNESTVYAAGRKPVSFVLPLQNGTSIRVGLAVCYDLRFPNLFRQENRPDLYLLPAAFTETTGRAHWEILLRARAIENLAYVCASAQAGRNSSGRSFWGHSMAVNPWGQILGELDGSETGVLFSEVDTRFIEQVRTSLPALNHRVTYDTN